MRYCAGFFVIEFLVCLVLFSYTVFFLMQFVVALSHMMRTHSSAMRTNVTLLTGLELIAHELEQAPVHKKNWLRCDPHFLIWRRNKKDIGFGLENRKAVRIKGSYDSESKRWKSKITNTIADSIDDIIFDYHWDSYDENIAFIGCTLTYCDKQQKRYTCSRLVRLVNGYV